MRVLLRALLLALPGSVICATATPDPVLVGVLVYVSSVAIIAGRPSKILWYDLGLPFIIGVVLIVYIARRLR